jgi:hypothetical protein
MEKKIATKNEKWEGGNETLSRGERESHPHTLMAYISGLAGVVNDSTTPKLTTSDTTHVGAFR